MNAPFPLTIALGALLALASPAAAQRNIDEPPPIADVTKLAGLFGASIPELAAAPEAAAPVATAKAEEAAKAEAEKAAAAEQAGDPEATAQQ